MAVSNASKRYAPLIQTSGRNMLRAHLSIHITKGAAMPLLLVSKVGACSLAYQRLSSPPICHVLILYHVFVLLSEKCEKIILSLKLSQMAMLQ